MQFEVLVKHSNSEKKGKCKLKNSIVKSTMQVTIIVFIIKVLGVLKQSVMASVCGATKETDAYFIATGVIIALCSAVFSSISISFLSIHTERLITRGRDEANNLVNAVLRVFIPISVVIALVFICFSYQIAQVLAPSYDASEINILSKYIRLMSIMFVFSCYYLIINVVLETNKSFLPGKGQNLFQNLFIIIATLFLYRYYGILSLIYAVIFSGFIQCIQITWNARDLFKVKKNLYPEKQTIKKLISISLPLIIGNAIYEINDIVDKRIASGLAEGSISTLSFGASINEIVTTLIISSLSTVLFAHFSSWVTEEKYEKIGNSLIKSLEVLLVIIMPIMIMCFICSDCIVDILYGHGGFGRAEVLRTSGVVIGYAVGFFFQATRANIVKVYYAFQDTTRPMVNGAISISINICLSFILSKYLGVSGIAFATSIAMIISTFLLLPRIYKYLPNFSLKLISKEFLKVIVVSLIVGTIGIIIRSNLEMNSIITLFLVGSIVVGMYLLLLILFKVNCVKEIFKKVIKFRRII